MYYIYNICDKFGKTMKYIYSFFSFLLLFTANLHSEDFDVNSLPKLLGSSNAGTEFYFTFLPCWDVLGGDLMIYITSKTKTKVTVEVNSENFLKTQNTIPNEVIEFRLAPLTGQPYRKNDREIPEPDQIYKRDGVHVFADDPIICYGVSRFQYT